MLCAALVFDTVTPWHQIGSGWLCAEMHKLPGEQCCCVCLLCLHRRNFVLVRTGSSALDLRCTAHAFADALHETLEASIVLLSVQAGRCGAVGLPAEPGIDAHTTALGARCECSPCSCGAYVFAFIPPHTISIRR